MPRIELAPEVFDDFDRFFDHMAEFGAAADAPQRIDEILQAVDLLAHSPLIGRQAKGGNRELVIDGARMATSLSIAFCRTSTRFLSWPSEANGRQATSETDRARHA